MKAVFAILLSDFHQPIRVLPQRSHVNERPADFLGSDL